jgi:hypothetical protein
LIHDVDTPDTETDAELFQRALDLLKQKSIVLSPVDDRDGTLFPLNNEIDRDFSSSSFTLKYC